MSLYTHVLSLWEKASQKTKSKIKNILFLLFAGNILVWVCAFFFARTFPFFLGLVVLAYGLGLRHAVDADHIAAIDNTTRKLIHDGKKPVSVGLFFSLGHATIVIILSLLVGISTQLVKQNLHAVELTGSIIGTSVSSIFLLFIGVINLITFLELFKIFRCVTSGGTCKAEIGHTHVHTKGFFTKLFFPLFKTITHSWQMYFIGLLFGLGFDTASEISLLSISAVSFAKGNSFFLSLLLPLAFTAGMALIDTLDGILMLGAYGWAYINPMRKLYYNLNITFISVIIALCIGIIEAVQLFSLQLKIQNNFFAFVNTIDLGKLGYITIFLFIFCWVVSIGIYKIKKYDQYV